MLLPLFYFYAVQISRDKGWALGLCNRQFCTEFHSFYTRWHWMLDSWLPFPLCSNYDKIWQLSSSFWSLLFKKLVMQLFSFSDFRLCGPEIFDGLDNFQCRFFKALSHSYKLAKGSRVWPTGHDGPWPFELHKYNLRSLRSLQGFACHGLGIDSIY